MSDESQMKQLANLISDTVVSTMQQQQATTAATAASSAVTGTDTAIMTLSPKNDPRPKVELQKFSEEEAN